MVPATLYRIRKFPDADERIVQRRLQPLGYDVSHYNRKYNGEKEVDLTGQLEHNHGRGDGMSRCAGQCRRSYTQTKEKAPKCCGLKDKNRGRLIMRAIYLYGLLPATA